MSMDTQTLTNILVASQRLTQLEVKQVDAIARFAQRVLANSSEKESLSEDDFKQWLSSQLTALQCFSLLMLCSLRSGNASMTQEDIKAVLTNITDKDFEQDDLENNSEKDPTQSSEQSPATINSYLEKISEWNQQNAVADMLGDINALTRMFPVLITDAPDAELQYRAPYLFTLHKGQFYSFASYWKNQTELASRLNKRLEQTASHHALTHILSSLEIARQETSFAAEGRSIHFRQWLAAYVAVKSPFSVITGGPGTGKTTVCAMVLRAMMSLESLTASDMVLCAPTGRAKSRLKESFAKNLESDSAQNLDLNTIEAKTVHNLLNMRPDGSSRFNESNPLPYKVIAVDESSMLDVAMFNVLLGAISDTTKLILLGDKDQLPSVEPGAVLGDITEQFVNQDASDKAHLYPTMSADELRRVIQEVESKPEHIPKDIAVALANEKPCLLKSQFVDKVVFLTKSHRSPQVTDWWTSLITGSNDEQSNSLELESQFEITLNETGAAQQNFVDKLLAQWVADYASEFQQYKSGLADGNTKSFNTLIEARRLLTVTNNGVFGRRRINEACYQHFVGTQLGSRNTKHLQGTPVIVLSNQKVKSYELFNGDLGVVIETDKTACFEIGGKLVHLPLSDIVNYDMAFAITVHKSQGSEFEHVTLLLPEKPNQLVTQQLIYTGVTRVKAVKQNGIELNHLRYIDPFGFLRSAENFPRKERRTGLLKAELDEAR